MTEPRALGHNVSGCRLGTNRGPNAHVVQELRSRLERLHHALGGAGFIAGAGDVGVHPADGFVAWPTCRYGIRPRRENVEVRGSHLGLTHNPAVLWLLADRLGQDEAKWKPLRSLLPLRPFFPRRG